MNKRKQKVRLIDANALREKTYPLPCAIGVEHAVTLRAIDEAPTIDAVPVVRCMDCVHAGWWADDVKREQPMCMRCCEKRKPDDFCSLGEKIIGGEETGTATGGKRKGEIDAVEG